MSNRRRHAHDFTNSLISFRQTISEAESSQTMSQTSLENKLDYIRNKQDEEDKHSCSKNNKSRASVILAGNLTSQQCTSSSNSNNEQPLSKDTWNVSDETSHLSDLNKCINLFHNEHLIKERLVNDSREEQLKTMLSETTISNNNIRHLNKNTAVRQQNFNERPRSMSTDSLKNINSCNQEFTRSKSYTTLDRVLKRDTNYNIKADQLSSNIAMKINRSDKIGTIVSSLKTLSLSKPSALSNKKDNSYSIEDDQKHDSTSSEKSSKEELNPSELRKFLHSLAEQKSVKEVAMQQHLLRRLSANYYDAPKFFTEGLLTIIEESIINNDSSQHPEISLRRFNEELRKMCKFIEDETVPEWPQSPGILTPIYIKRKSRTPKSNLSWKSLAYGTPNKDLYLTPVSSQRNIKSPNKIIRRMSKNASYATKNLHDSTSTFENLEAYCEKLFPDEYKTSSARKKNQSQSPLRRMDNIRSACENQMASLDGSFNVHEEIKKAGTCTSDSTNEYNKTPEAQNLLHRLSCEKYDRTDSKKVSDTFKQRTKRSKHEMIELDDLENTLMYEIAKKRQRCLDTAKIMIEIDESMKSTEATKKTCPNIVINESSPTNDDTFMKILMCVKKYQDYLEKNKSQLNSFYPARLNNPRTPDRKDVRAKKMCNKNFGTCASPNLLGNELTLQTTKLSPKGKSISPSSAKYRSAKTIVSKSRLFVTPGKTPVKGCRPKRTYFPNLLPELNTQEDCSIKKKIYRQMGNYDHVISPVGMYIKGMDSHSKKNLRSKTEMLLTEKKQTTRSSNPKMKFLLSPKRPREKVTGTTVGDKKVAHNFLHSKVHGKFPSQIEEMENRKVRNRINDVPRSTPGRMKSAKTDHLQ